MNDDEGREERERTRDNFTATSPVIDALLADPDRPRLITSINIRTFRASNWEAGETSGASSSVTPGISDYPASARAPEKSLLCRLSARNTRR